MKKLFFTLLTATSLIACSSDDDSSIESNDEEIKLTSYHKVFSSGNTATYNYDNAPNPFEDNYRKYYIQYLLIYGGLGNFEEALLANKVTLYGNNNMFAEEYPEGISIQNQIFTEYTYNDEGYPITATGHRISPNGTTISVSTFIY